MFYTPEISREWKISSIYEERVGADALQKTIQEMESLPEAPGYCDVGTRNFLYTMILNIRPRRVLEVGLHIGVGAVIMAHALRMNGYGRLISIEPSITYRQIAEKYINKAGLIDYFEICPHFSYEKECLEQLRENAPFELIYIDANHSYDDAYLDISLMSKLLLDNGFMILHDVGRSSDSFDESKKGGVRQALYDFCKKNKKFKVIFFEHPLWMNSCGLALVCKQSYDPPMK